MWPYHISIHSKSAFSYFDLRSDYHAKRSIPVRKKFDFLIDGGKMLWFHEAYAWKCIRLTVATLMCDNCFCLCVSQSGPSGRGTLWSLLLLQKRPPPLRPHHYVSHFQALAREYICINLHVCPRDDKIWSHETCEIYGRAKQWVNGGGRAGATGGMYHTRGVWGLAFSTLHI